MRQLAAAALLALLPALGRAYVGPTVDVVRFPSTVHLDLDRGQNTRQRCTAVVIGPRVALTAAHCVGEFHNNAWGCLLRDVNVLVGRADRPAVSRRLRGIVAHPSVVNERQEWWEFFPSPAYEGLSDVAVLVFDSDLGYPATSLAASLTPRQPVHVGGYGQYVIDGRDYSRELRMGAHTVAGLGGAQFSAASGERAGFVLHGDSGGPVYDNAGHVVGINSWIRADRQERVYPPGGREYTRIVSYTSNFSRTDTLSAWVRAASDGRAGNLRCPFRR